MWSRFRLLYCRCCCVVAHRMTCEQGGVWGDSSNLKCTRTYRRPVRKENINSLSFFNKSRYEEKYFIFCLRDNATGEETVMSSESNLLGIWNRPNTSRATKAEAYTSMNQYLEYLGRVPATGRVGTATCCCCASTAAAVCTMHDGQQWRTLFLVTTTTDKNEDNLYV